MNLPNDVYRCDGVEGLEICAKCLRKIAPRPEECFVMPPQLIDGECDFVRRDTNKKS